MHLLLQSTLSSLLSVHREVDEEPSSLRQTQGGEPAEPLSSRAESKQTNTRSAGQQDPARIGPAGARKDTSWACNGLVVTTTWNYYIDPFQPQRHYICYTDIGFARSLDAGRTWKWWAIQDQAPWSNTCYELAFDPDVPGKVWGAFSNVHDIPNANIISGRHRSEGPGGVCVSTDSGATWKVSNAGLPVAPTLSLVLDPRARVGRAAMPAAAELLPLASTSSRARACPRYCLCTTVAPRRRPEAALRILLDVSPNRVSNPGADSPGHRLAKAKNGCAAVGLRSSG